MQFSSALCLGPRGSVRDFQAAVLDRGGEVLVGDTDPHSGLVPLRPTAVALAETGFERLVAFGHGDLVVRVLATTSTPDEDALQKRFGPPTRHNVESGARLWAFEDPDWSVEARPRAHSDGHACPSWELDAKFLADAVRAGVLTQDYVRGLFRTLRT